MIKKILIVLVVLVLVVVIGFVLFVNTSYEINHDKDYPVTEITIKADSASVARGKYLVNGPAHCSYCHAPFEKLEALERGEDVAFTGGLGLDIPPGIFYAPNITSDSETGIGNNTDGEIYRMLRYNIRPNGHASFDFMPFINMSEDDIYAVIAYLRTLKPVKYEMQETELSFLGKMIYAMGGIKPGVPDEPFTKSVESGETIEYGKYLASAVANCRGCHTNRNMETGEYIGEEYAGGLAFGPDNLSGDWIFTSPNLTNDPETGILYDWSVEKFIARMKAGRVHATSPMPWSAFASTSESDLRAVFMFLKSLEPVNNNIENTVMEAEK